MKYFKDEKGSVFAFAKDGSQDSFIPDGLIEIAQEEADLLRFKSPSKSELIIAQILDIESSITTRRIREAVLGIDDGWLAGVDAQIAALRKKL